MDELRLGIGLRAVGHDPLLGVPAREFESFPGMPGRIRTAVAEMAFQISIVPEEGSPRRRSCGICESSGAAVASGRFEGTVEGSLDTGGIAKPSLSGADQKWEETIHVPAGSGKKFKHCCGRVGA
ncbi:MAG: hypothetical protein MZU95_07650 [Desulfomicrobium escambiense]|nr:hypothetical protein [Desulfomicrobium escambiense]